MCVPAWCLGGEKGDFQVKEKDKKQKCPWLLIGLMVGILVSSLYGSGLLDRLEWIVYDLKFQIRGKVASDKNIVEGAPLVIVAIDEQSLKDLGRWPWSRGCHAELIDKLSRAGARTIAMDVLFAEPEQCDPDGSKEENNNPLTPFIKGESTPYPCQQGTLRSNLLPSFEPCQIFG